MDIDNENTIESSDMNISSCPKQGTDAWNDYGQWWIKWQKKKRSFHEGIKLDS